MGDGIDVSRMRMSRAEPRDLAAVAGVLEDASGWLHARGIDQWPLRFSDEWIGPPIERGETWLATIDGDPAGTLTLSHHDPAWPQDEMAAYLHRIAVRRSFAGLGLGLALLDWAGDEARLQGRRLLRLDCAAGNERLRRYYLDAGFRPKGEAIVHGVDVARFERPVP